MEPRVEFTNFSDVMKASPFDPEYDLNRTLTEDIYYNHLHVQTERQVELIEMLGKLIDSKLEPNRVIFMRGHAGNGKTTFLHSFMRADDNEHVYYDFQELRRTLGGEASDDFGSDDIQLFLNRRLRDMSRFAETLKFLHANRRTLKDADFISARLYAALAKAGEEPDDEITNDWLDSFEYRDSLAITFVHLFRNVKPGKKTILFFDNLDVAPMDHIANRFLVYFQNALSSATYISRHELFANDNVDFRRDFRFVFCMRDANDAMLNAHLAHRAGFVQAPFVVSFDADVYRSIAEKRVQFVESYFPEHDVKLYSSGSFTAVLGAILADDYFRDVFLPLYNNDYREIAGLLVRLIQKLGITLQQRRYERRGMLMFGIIDDLLTRDFLRDYMKITADPWEGYCYIDRVMLTVLINCSDYRRGGPHGESCEAYSLFYIVQDLDKVYRNVPAVLRSIARCFVSHQFNRVHLITVMNRRVLGVEEFVRTYKDMFDVAMKNSDDSEVLKVRNELNSILIRVNPAGFTYVRYVLPHFEFYANVIGDTVRGQENSPLFADPLRRVRVDNEMRFAFEVKIDAVLAQVRTHIESMKKFFDSRYAAVMPAEKFPSSVYCFRHTGAVRLATKKGHSHAIKIVTAHIDYIDSFRLQFVGQVSAPDVRRRINESLVSRIERYVQMLALAPDTEVAGRFRDQFNHAIQSIRNSGYNDISTRIEREGPRARDEAAISDAEESRGSRHTVT